MVRYHTGKTFFACALLSSPLFGQADEEYKWPTQPPTSLEQFANEVDGYLASLDPRGFSGVVLVAEKGKTLLHKAYGYADRQAARKMTTGTGFDIGSIVKPMTKAAIIKLESDGKLSLADPLTKHFENVPPDKAEITLQMVLDHKAGFPDIFGDDYEPAKRDEVVGKLLNAPLISKPGEKFNYSNAGYSLLAALIEKISGKPYERYMTEEIFKPAGVKRIGYQIPAWKNEELAVGYSKGRRWGTPLDHAWMEDGPSWNLRGNGGMLSTVEELYQWFDAALSGRVMPGKPTQTYRDQMFKEGRLGKRTIGVAGGNDVFNALYINVDEMNLVFVIFTNVDNLSGEEVSKPLRERLVAMKAQKDAEGH
jgi:CubicO group peptidase (beta-lactamase class C family)